MRRYAVVGCECPPLGLSKYCTSREAVFVCTGHLLVSDSADGNGDQFLTGYNDLMISYEIHRCQSVLNIGARYRGGVLG